MRRIPTKNNAASLSQASQKTVTARSIRYTGRPTDKYSPDVVPPIHAVSYHVATDKPPAKDGDKFWSILATIYNQSQRAERKHVACHWLINTAATAVPLSAHPSPLVITTKLAAAIFGGGCTEEVFCRPSTAPVGRPVVWPG